MSFRTVQQNTAEKTDTLSVSPIIPSRIIGQSWVRNPTWPNLPSISSTDEKIVGIIAITSPITYIGAAFSTGGAGGSIQVDWGDGNINTYTSGSLISKTYDYTAAALDNTNGPVTFQDSGDTVTRNNHGYQNDNIISFYEITTTTGIIPGQSYYVINATTNTFQLSNTKGGSPISLTNDGTGIILPYKIATFIVTPVNSGATITNANFTNRNSIISSSNFPVNQWLDVSVAMSGTGLTFGFTNAAGCTFLEKCTILRTGATNLDSLFNNCRSLQSVSILQTGNVTSAANMFTSCISLVTFSFDFSTANITNMSGMFNGCTNLVTVNNLNTNSATNLSNLFAGCRNLINAPYLRTNSVTNMSGMFSGCQQLTSVPLYNTASVTNMNSMFSGCGNLFTVPFFNTAAVTDMAFMFNSCTAIQTVPFFNTANVTNMSGMFANCSALVSVPLFNTSNVTAIGTTTANQGMFSSCVSLVELPLFDFSKVTIAGYFASNCISLTTLPPFNFSAVVGTLSSNNNGLSFAFFGCSNVVSIGVMSIQNCLTYRSMFENCSKLQYVPKMTLGCGYLANMFAGCSSLTEIADIVVPSNGRNLTNFLGNFTNFNLSRLRMTGLAVSFSLSTMKFSGPALDEVYTNLPTVTGQIITVSNNPGIATDNPSIATAKGWTVSGS